MAKEEKKKEIDKEEVKRTCNFAAGPAVLPLPVLLEAQKDLVSYKGKGLSVMEMSHRSKEFEDIVNTAFEDIRDLLKIPKNYKVLFMQGGATLQFSAIPLNFNLANSNKVADYIVTGEWSSKCAKEAQKFGKINVAFDNTKTNPPCTKGPKWDELKFSEDAAYLHLCVNETVHGLLLNDFPFDNVKCPIVADYSSCFMSDKIDISKFGVIYAGAQKNIGPAGVVVVIVREDLLGKADPKIPIMLDWKTCEGAGSMYNTPPCWSIYIMGLVFKWLKSIGGLDAMYDINVKKAKLIYDVIDENDDFYVSPVDKNNRSLMNIRFGCKDGEKMDEKFLSEAKKLGLDNLKGYRTIGQIRASVYNAQPIENCQILAKFMKDFCNSNKK